MKKRIMALLCAAAMLLSVGCSSNAVPDSSTPSESSTASSSESELSSDNISSDETSNADIGDTTPPESSDKENESGEDNNDSDDTDINDSSDNEASADEQTLVSDGIFTTPDKKLSFELAEGWALESSDIMYVFSNPDNANAFTLIQTGVTTPVERLTENDMTSIYTVNMEEFRLMEFNHLEISGCPAAYVQFSGKLSQMNKTSTITLCTVQAGDDTEYQFAFTETVYDYTFQSIIDRVISTLKISR